MHLRTFRHALRLAFTLIELLVVIAIISVLMGTVVASSAKRARQCAIRAVPECNAAGLFGDRQLQH